MEKMPSQTQNKVNAFLVGLVLMALAWVAASWMDANLFGRGTFSQQLIAPELHEIAMRLLIFCVVLLMMIYSLRAAGVQARLKDSLSEAQHHYLTEKARSEAILSALSDAISVQDLNLKVLYQNQAHKNLVGEHGGEYCYAAYQHKDHVCEGCHLVQSFSDGFCHRREASATTERGVRHVEIFSSPLRDANGTIIAGIESVRDITERREAEEKLRIQQAAMEAAMDGIAIFSETRGFIYMNPSFLVLFGYESPADLLSASWRVLYPPEESARYERENRPTFLRDGRWRGELIGKRRDDSTLPLEISLTRIEGGDVILVARDITAQKRFEQENEALSQDLAERAAALLATNKELLTAKNRAEEEKNKSEAIIAAMGEGVSIQSLDFKVLYQNKVHQDIVGGSFVGSHCYQVYACHEKICEGCPVIRCYKDGLIHKLFKILPSGTPIEVTASPLRDSGGTIIAGIEVVRDMTQHVKSEQALQAQANVLQQQTRDLIATNRELESFSYTLSHDLRSPLTRIYVAAQALAEMYGEVLDENGRLFLHSICDASEHMEELIEAILGLSGVARSELHAEEVDLSGLVAVIAAELHVPEPERRVDFVLAAGVTAFCDLRLMKVALENLVGNAWKYSRNISGARIEFGVTERDGEAIYFVRDNGAGFDMRDADGLFMPFKRLHASKDFPGTGIGLATVQRIIERHGGNIWAEAAVGKGATFYFTLKQLNSISLTSV